MRMVLKIVAVVSLGVSKYAQAQDDYDLGGMLKVL